MKSKRRCLLQLVLLDEVTLVLVNDGEDRLDVIGGFASQADLSEEILVIERAISCDEKEKGAFQTHTHTQTDVCFCRSTGSCLAATHPQPSALTVIQHLIA